MCFWKCRLQGVIDIPSAKSENLLMVLRFILALRGLVRLHLFCLHLPYMANAIDIESRKEPENK